jgi:hypothetical protein
MKLSELKNPEVVAKMRAAILRQAPKCEVCATPIQESITGRRSVDGKDYCSDCYYDDIGAEIERMPLSSPRRNSV